MKPGCLAAAFFAILTLLAATAICGCASDRGTITDSIESVYDSDWRLDQLEGRSVPVEAATITMQLLKSKESDKKREKGIEDGQVSGSTGVNRYSGTYVSDRPGSIRFGPLAATRRAGAPDQMQRESQFLAAMERVTAFRLHADMMSMGDGDATLLVWRR